MTDNTETSIRLNSSKQPQAPHCAKPEKILPMDWRRNKKEKYEYVEYKKTLMCTKTEILFKLTNIKQQPW